MIKGIQHRSLLCSIYACVNATAATRANISRTSKRAGANTFNLKPNEVNSMSDLFFSILLALIPVFGALISRFLIPLLKARLSAAQLTQISQWVTKTVQAAEVLFDQPKSGTEKRAYVISMIDELFNSKKELLTREQIEILLEAAWKEMNQSQSQQKGR
jgi:hypothetical protein